MKELNKSSKTPNPNCQSSTFSSNGHFKIDNRSFTTLFQGEVECLNLINHNFSKVLDSIQVQYACDCLIKGFLIGVTFSRLLSQDYT